VEGGPEPGPGPPSTPFPWSEAPVSGTWDATIMLVYAAADGGAHPIDAVGDGDAFEVVAHIRIGRNLMQFVDTCELFVSVRNLSRSTTLLSQHQSYVLVPQDAPHEQRLQVKVAAGWEAGEGDALEVLATLKVTAGINADYTLARSAPFVVCR
jgi:hypothetical protein